MDHSEVRELLEDAAIEPGGLERLMAGDTATAAIIAGHVAGCPDCGEELDRLNRSVALIRPVVGSVPPPELRERTLAYVAAVGRPRGTATALATEPSAPARPTEPSASSRPAPAAGRRLATLAGIAAALIVAVAGTGLLVSADRDAASRTQAAQIEALANVARWTLRVEAEPDARRIALASTTGDPAVGSLLYSPSTTALVVVADRLAPPPAGREYRCWVEVDGARAAIGKMYFGGGVAYWVGDVEQVVGLGTNARFGVSIVDLATPDVPGEPVLIGGG